MSLYNYCWAPIAQRIEHLSSKEAMKVRFPLGAPRKKLIRNFNVAVELIFNDYLIPY